MVNASKQIGHSNGKWGLRIWNRYSYLCHIIKLGFELTNSHNKKLPDIWTKSCDRLHGKPTSSQL